VHATSAFGFGLYIPYLIFHCLVTIRVLFHHYVYVLVFFVLYKNGARQYVMPCRIYLGASFCILRRGKVERELAEEHGLCELVPDEKADESSMIVCCPYP